MFATVPLRIMSWNIQFGEGTDAVTNYDRTASWIATNNPDIVGLCEVPFGSAPALVALLTAKTGRVWFSHFAPKYIGTDEGNLILSRRSEEHTSELQSQSNLVCRLLLEKKKKIKNKNQ